MITNAPVLNISAGSDDLRGRELSNLQRRKFILDNVELASVEGFVQGIKYSLDDPERLEIFKLAGLTAKRKSPEKSPPFVWWNSEEIAYGSKEHHALIERAIRASFEQNPIALALLYSTKGMTLTHDLGHPESPHTCLPAAVFCDILTRLRDEGTDKDQYRLAEELHLIPPVGSTHSDMDEIIEQFKRIKAMVGESIALCILFYVIMTERRNAKRTSEKKK